MFRCVEIICKRIKFLRFEVAKFLEREREKAGISCEIALISESHSIAKRIAE